MTFADTIANARKKLRPFNAAASCRACGCTSVRTRHHHAHERQWGDLVERLIGVPTSFVPFDLMERECTRCGKAWAELPLDESEVPRD